LHANGRSVEGLPILEDACRQRQELLDASPKNLDYRAELASCWNDLGLALDGAKRYDDSAAAQERAVALQQLAVEAAPQVTRYRRLLCNHLFNRAMALVRAGRLDEAMKAATDARLAAPNDPEQCFREARILALVAERSGRADHADLALAALRQAIIQGYDDQDWIRTFFDHAPMRDRPGFRDIMTRVGQRATTGSAISEPSRAP
jgi:tetratricopeptide (TPR) repeat protein